MCITVCVHTLCITHVCMYNYLLFISIHISMLHAHKCEWVAKKTLCFITMFYCIFKYFMLCTRKRGQATTKTLYFIIMFYCIFTAWIKYMFYCVFSRSRLFWCLDSRYYRSWRHENITLFVFLFTLYLIMKIWVITLLGGFSCECHLVVVDLLGLEFIELWCTRSRCPNLIMKHHDMCVFRVSSLN